jgi:HSP20 family protein
LVDILELEGMGMTKSKEIKDLAPVNYWDPSTMFEEMERFLNERKWDRDLFWFPRMMRSTYRVPAVDVREEDDRYVITAELPGMKREDLTLEIGDGALEITAKKESASEERAEGYLRRERGSMFFHRRMVLPDDVDTQGVEARLNDGVLEVVLNKTIKGNGRKKVDVQ